MRGFNVKNEGLASEAILFLSINFVLVLYGMHVEKEGREALDSFGSWLLDFKTLPKVLGY